MSKKNNIPTHEAKEKAQALNEIVRLASLGGPLSKKARKGIAYITEMIDTALESPEGEAMPGSTS